MPEQDTDSTNDIPDFLKGFAKQDTRPAWLIEIERLNKQLWKI
jgi:hypothetical protein